jgi:hypothetical protein
MTDIRELDLAELACIEGGTLNGVQTVCVGALSLVPGAPVGAAAISLYAPCNPAVPR